jgi:hypothetical protein
MAKNKGRSSDQPLFGHWVDMASDTAKDRPLATAAAVGGAVAAGVFLWSRRNQISDQLNNLSEQIGDWRESMRSGREASEFESMGATSTSGGTATDTTRTSGSTRATGSRATTSRGRTARTTRGMSETGGGNASLGAHSGAGGLETAPSGRGRAKPTRTSATRE